MVGFFLPGREGDRELEIGKPGSKVKAMVWNGGKKRSNPILKRGDVEQKGEDVGVGVLTALSDNNGDASEWLNEEALKKGDGRDALAHWLTDSDKGAGHLLARVIVNRLWQHHFGVGLVKTSNNFGQVGEKPTHPELLNWLANELVAGGWKLKRMHKLIMMSKTYQMSSRGNEKALAKDPNNDFMWRYDMRRLSAEEIRDSILNLTGKLNLKMGGPSIYTEVPRDVLATASRPGGAWGNSSEEDRNRRSVYIFVKRSLHEPFLSAFDWADTDNTCDVRFVTTVPTQTLTLMNSKFLNDSAETLAKHVAEVAPGDATAQIRHALHKATHRKPTDEEVQDGLDLIKELKEKTDASQEDAMQRFCLLVLNLNEFLYLD